MICHSERGKNTWFHNEEATAYNYTTSACSLPRKKLPVYNIVCYSKPDSANKSV